MQEMNLFNAAMWPVKALYLLEFSWGFYVEQGLDLSWIGFYSSVVDHEVEKLARVDSTRAFGQIHPHFVFSKNSKGLA